MTFKTYDEIKDRLEIQIRKLEGNESLTFFVAHKVIEDLLLTYHISLLDDDQLDLKSTMVVNLSMLELFNVSVEQLHKDAVENSVKKYPCTIKSMNSMFGIPGEDLDGVPYVVLSQAGAAVLEYPEMYDQLAEKFGRNFYILPSSIYEIIVVPDDGNIDAKSLLQMVVDVNATVVAPEERLTDSVYYYNITSKVFELVAKAA